MVKKRKSENTGLDEIDKTMYATFCSAANSLSQLYTQGQHQQKLAFQEGERHSLEKMLQWIAREHDAGSRLLSITDVYNYIQKELDCGGDEISMSPSVQCQNPPHSQQQTQNSAFQSQVTSGGASQGLVTPGPRVGLPDQSKNTVFSNALSSPVRRSLQSYNVVQGYCSPNNTPLGGSGTRRFGSATDQDQGHFNYGGNAVDPHSSESHALNSMIPSHTYEQQPHQMRDSNSYGEYDSIMDMHSDSPSQGFY
eukprot:TRINITY_DN10835_c0_g1_i1.p1 TRINITY_DN10835_c0_g1~~TRINITY_DN10835_c0_g1_i1.p1  ORF type:complete len:252 (-),score=51.17 TRINITY_DN10835_c0_g1_i1:221-976(-)